MSRRLWIIASAALLAVCVAPFALAAGEGRPVNGGARNPSSNESQSYTRETELIANNSTYGTRQSNKSDNGGGAIYGCRSGEGGTGKGNQPCIRANNLAKGYAFEFATSGVVGGSVTVGNGGDGTKPFTTNATGVADGLNADRVDGKSASDIVADAQAQNRFAQVTAAGKTGASRGVDSAAHESTGVYRVAFTGDVSNCAYNATVVEDGTQQGFATVQPVDATTL
ncbi:MAG TPA: hypothetical protein VGJ70_17185, partial [Solirubrobacteraceae bacterium]